MKQSAATSMHDNASAQDLPNSSLVVRARTDREAFGERYERHHYAIYRYCQRRLPDQAATEDACANAFLAVARKISEFRGATDDDFKRWVYRIATNEINAYWRRSVRRSALLATASRRGEIHSTIADSLEPQSDSAALQLLQEAVRQLSPRDQSLISLRYFENMSHDEIAEILNMRSGAVRTALSRALGKLRRQLANIPI